MKERNADLISLSLTVPLEAQAAAICGRWKDKCQDVYAFLMKELL